MFGQQFFEGQFCCEGWIRLRIGLQIRAHVVRLNIKSKIMKNLFNLLTVTLAMRWPYGGAILLQTMETISGNAVLNTNLANESKKG